MFFPSSCLAASLLCAFIGTVHSFSTYIIPEYPPDGAYSFVSHGEYWSIPGAVLSCLYIMIGAYYCALGYRFMKVSLWGSGFLLPFIIVFYGMNAYNLDIWWFNAITAVTIGMVVSVVSLFLFGKLLFFSLGFMCGFVIVAQFLVAFISLAWDPSWFIIFCWCMSVLGGVLYGILSFYFGVQRSMKQKGSCIVNTSILGGYLTVMGLDFFSQDRYAAVLITMFTGQTVEVHPWYVSLVFMMTWLIISVFSSGLQRMIISSRTFHYKPTVEFSEEYDLP